MTLHKNYIDNQEKTLLYLDTRDLPLERNAEILAAKDLGYQVMMATPNPAVYNGYNIDHMLEVNVGNFDQARTQILDFIQKQQLTVTGILVWKDREVVLAAQLGEALGLPHTPLDKVENVRNKSKTREVLESLGNLNPRYAVVRDESSFLEALHMVGLPAVLKQAGNSGSRGMCVIENIENAVQLYQEVLAFNQSQIGDMYHYYEDTMLLEEKLIGSEHSLAGVVADGEVISFAIADKKFDQSLPLQYENIVPTALPAEQQARVIEQLKAAVVATGINWCGYHVDFMITENGLKILEIGGRLGGEMINSHLIPLAVPGLNSYKTYIDIVQGYNPLTFTDYSTKATSKAASRVMMPDKIGMIKSVSGVQNIVKSPYCRALMQTFGVGDEIVLPDVRFKGYEIGYFIAQCELSQDMNEIIASLIDKISITVD